MGESSTNSGASNLGDGRRPAERFYRPQGAPIARLNPTQDRCPTCKQQLGTRAADLKRTRVCRDCERPIGRHDKFTISPDGLRHRNCDDPEDYK